MAKSSRLRAIDVHAIWRLVGDCRDLGDDQITWRNRWVSGLADLVDADLGLAGEMAGCHDLRADDLGVTFWWRPGAVDLDFLVGHMARFRDDPHYSPAMMAYFRRYREDDGLCLSRREFIDDRAWYHSSDYELIQGPLGMDSTLWCYCQAPGSEPGETSNVILLRGHGRREFQPRDVAIVREAQAVLSPLVGGPLARFADPAPSRLSPRLQQVLACLLEGDSDKQIAARLGLAAFTVNDHTKAIFRYFGVRGRAELMARWIRRRWGSRPIPDEPMTVVATACGASFYANQRRGKPPSAGGPQTPRGAPVQS